VKQEVVMNSKFGIVITTLMEKTAFLRLMFLVLNMVFCQSYIEAQLPTQNNEHRPKNSMIAIHQSENVPVAQISESGLVWHNNQSIAKVQLAVPANEDWEEQGPHGWYAGRQSHGMAYIGGDRALLFGGSSGGRLQDTWVYDLSNDSWTQKGGANKPYFREDHAMAYLGVDKVLLFGGSTAYGVWDNETWIYDLSDNTWTKVEPPTKPSARFDHAMAYIGGDQVILFGGALGYGNIDGQTWIYDLSNNTWTQKNPASSPSPRSAHALAYLGGDRVILYGGATSWSGYGVFSDETWVYDLSENTWTLKTPSNKPPQRVSHAMAYLGGDRVVLFGGYGPYNGMYGEPLGDTWIYDLSDNAWSQDTDSPAPEARHEHTLCETSMNGSTPPILFAGAHDWLLNDLSMELWTYGKGTLQYYLIDGHDFNGDWRSDISVWNPFTGMWQIRGIGTYQWGNEGDIPVSGDYDGYDGKTNIAVWRPSTGTWWIRDPYVRVIQWGQSGDVPVPDDYNGDRITDIAVWRPSTGMWWIRDPYVRVIQWGQSGDVPVPGDYNGDGITDIAVWRPSTGMWWIRDPYVRVIQWGQSGDIPVPDDYNGDRIADIAVWRPSTGMWWIRDPYVMVIQWGEWGDIPVPGDYNGDLTADAAIWRPSTGKWWIRDPYVRVVQWGEVSDIPLVR
jgi:putative transposon-encoded protein